MRIFVFDVSPGWDYCGGALVVIAKSLGEAIDLLLGYEDEDGGKELAKHSFYASVDAIPNLEKHYYTHDPAKFFYKKDQGWDEWVLSGEFEVNETVPRVVLVSYNYA